MDDTQLHVLVLNSEQQATARFCCLLLFSLNTLSSTTKLAKNPDKLEKYSSEILNNLKKYDAMVDRWPSLTDKFVPGPIDIFYIPEIDFKLLIKATNEFKHENARVVGGSDIADFVDFRIDGLRALIDASKDFSYSPGEIRKELIKSTTPKK